MPLELKEKLTLQDALVEAARRRASDEAHREFTIRQLDSRTKRILSGKTTRMGPVLLPGNSLDSYQMREFLKDSKYLLGTLAGQSTNLEGEVQSLARANFALLDDLQKNVAALDSDITEREVETFQKFTQVHFNSFVRPQDAGLDFDDEDWRVDPKTQIPFLAGHVISIIPGAGVTLPTKEVVKLSLKDVHLVGEETDVGDTKQPIQGSPARNIMLSDRVFRHVIIRRDYDETSRKFRRIPSYCTFLLELSGVQLVNTIRVRPLGHNPVKLESLAYVNEAGEEVALTTVETSADRELTLLFEPVRAKYFKVRFVQYGPVSRMAYSTGDLRVEKLNEALEGVGFSMVLPSQGEEIYGRVFDFSMEEISLELRIYETLGFYRSPRVATSSPVGLALSDQVEVIQISNDQRTYGNRYFLNEGEVLLERYAGLHLEDASGAVLYHDLIPIPDTYPIQREWLPLHGGEGRLKLYPDLIWNLSKIAIASASESLGGWDIVLSEPHGLTPYTIFDPATDACILGPVSIGLNGCSEKYTSLSESEIRVTLTTTPPSGGELAEGERPTAYLYFRGDQEAPLTVYRENDTLVVGVDYEVSLNGGSTWHSTWPTGDEFTKAVTSARAGDFRVRILSPDYAKLYWVEYRIARNQALGSGSGVSLRNGKVVFDRVMLGTKGWVNTMFVLRAQNDNPYISPILLSYFLKLREYDGS